MPPALPCLWAGTGSEPRRRKKAGEAAVPSNQLARFKTLVNHLTGGCASRPSENRAPVWSFPPLRKEAGVCGESEGDGVHATNAREYLQTSAKSFVLSSSVPSPR